ncbi:MAG: hypothetical protein ACOC91_03630 [bacterium]
MKNRDNAGQTRNAADVETMPESIYDAIIDRIEQHFASETDGIDGETIIKSIMLASITAAKLLFLKKGGDAGELAGFIRALADELERDPAQFDFEN